MDIIALPASPLSGAAPTATPGASPAPVNAGGGFARSLEQAASRQTADAAAAPQARSLRAASAETPAAAAVAVQAPGLLGLSVTPPASGTTTQKEAAPPADERPEEAPADLAAMLLQVPPVPAAPAAGAAADLPETDIPDELQRIRSRLLAIESAGQLPFPGTVEAALASLPAQTAPSPLPATASLPAVTVTPLSLQTTAASIEQSRPALSTPPPDAGQAGFAGSDQAGQTPALAEGTRAVHPDALPESIQAGRTEPLMEDTQASRPEPLTEGAQASHAELLPEGPRASHAASLAENIRAGDSLPPGLESTSGSGTTYPLASNSPSTGGPATAGSPAGVSLAAPLASPEWQRGLGQHLLGLQQRGEQEIELHLHPAELGPLSISLKLGESGAQAQFLSSHPQVRAAVEQAIPQLREALAEQGIALGETSVGERQQRSRDERPDSSGRGAALAGGAGEDRVPGVAEIAAPLSVRLEGVDLYA